MKNVEIIMLCCIQMAKMSKSLLAMVIVLYAMLYIAQSQYCYINNCQECSNFTICTYCSPGYNCCSLNCQQCSNTTCSSCQLPYILANNLCILNSSCDDQYCVNCVEMGQCLSCANRYFFVPTVNQCFSCGPNCLSCTNYTYCLVCVDGYFNYTGDCLTCPTNCTVCNMTGCITCADNTFWFYQMYQCYSCLTISCVQCTNLTYCIQCAQGYLPSQGGLCMNCSLIISNCLGCAYLSNSSISCSSCLAGYYLGVNSGGGETCLACPNGCTACISASICSSCVNGLFLNQTNQCQLCSIINCAQCQSSAVCLACMPGYYLSGEVCMLCYINCMACSNMSTCIQCFPGFFLAGQTCQLCNSTCLTCTGSAFGNCTCSVGNYPYAYNQYQNIKRGCSACGSGCYSCMGYEIYAEYSSCFLCFPGYYMVTTTNTSNLYESWCLPCPINCLYCFPSGQNLVCNFCLNGFYLSNQSCLSCLPACYSCLDFSSCFTCNSNYYLNGSSCQPCGKNCANCLNQTYCISCISGYQLVGESCEGCQMPANCNQCFNSNCLTCNPGYFLQNQTSCESCPQNCQSCNNAFSCSWCNSGYYLASNGACVTCSPCITCYNATYCLSCPSYTSLNATHQCPFCNDCQSCVNSSICITCNEGFALIGTVCQRQPGLIWWQLLLVIIASVIAIILIGILSLMEGYFAIWWRNREATRSDGERYMEMMSESEHSEH